MLAGQLQEGLDRLIEIEDGVRGLANLALDRFGVRRRRDLAGQTRSGLVIWVGADSGAFDEMMKRWRCRRWPPAATRLSERPAASAPAAGLFSFLFSINNQTFPVHFGSEILRGHLPPWFISARPTGNAPVTKDTHHLPTLEQED